MSDENQESPGAEEQWEAPPIPEEVAAEPEEKAEMSEASTLFNIFIEPGRTFEDLRKKPRFILAFIIIAVLATSYVIALQQKVGEDGLRRAALEQTQKVGSVMGLSQEQVEQAAENSVQQQKFRAYLAPLGLAVVFLIGGLLYWLGMKAFGGKARFFHGVSVFVYSSFPPVVINQIANGLMLLFKPADDINYINSQRGLIRANPTLFFSNPDMPVLTTLLSTIDVFVIWGLILAAIGLHKVGKISNGAAWTIVLILALLGITFRVVFAAIFGVAT